MKTYYWHDYETFGIDPQRDRPAQFAGVRTDEDFNIIDDPLVIYCKPSTDYLPNPDACLITGITPQLANEKGVCEAEFIAQIHAELAQPNTCTVGYNNIRFDDEVTRNCLYRNFYDPYAREWQDGNSRWDLIDVVRAARALRPDGIEWPVDEAGVATNRLDKLTVVNNIAHEAAHDALSDVTATIALAKLIKTAQPKLFQYLLAHRLKAQVNELLSLGSFTPLVHVSGMYPTKNHALAIVVPICQHPTNNNGVIVYDLSVDPEPLLSLSVEDIKARIFTPRDELPEGVERIPLKTVHINKCPVLAPISVIKPSDAVRLNVDLERCLRHSRQISQAIGLAAKLAEVFSEKHDNNAEIDPDVAIYTGGFLTEADKQKSNKIRSSSPAELSRLTFTFNDPRLGEMFFRYKGRNYPETLNSADQARWQQFCKDRLLGNITGGGLHLEAYRARLNELKLVKETPATLINALTEFAQTLCATHSI